LKIAIISTPFIGGGSERAKMYKAFLVSRNHDVILIQLPIQSLAGKILHYYQRALANLQNHEESHMKKTADFLEKRIKKEKFDVVICVYTEFSYVLTRDLDCLKIFSCESLADELFFDKSVNIQRARKFREMELEIMSKSDYVVFPWKTTEDYARKYIYNGSNLVTIRFGCTPQEKTVSYFFPASIISLGNLNSYWSNKELLSNLTKISPFRIDVYGKYQPSKRYKLNYKGYASSLDLLYYYQFGLNTVSKDIYRQNHFSSRVLGYLSYGLPVLSPDWMKLSHELKGVLPYNENNFLEVLEKFSDPQEWVKKSNEAHDQAVELNWNEVLKPLDKIISSRNVKS
jgi:hypothetical protein